MRLEDYRPMMERCSNCLSCKWIPYDKIQDNRFGENCPAVCYYNFNTYSARGRFQMAQSLLDGRTTYTDTVTDVIHSCLSCGACDVSCKICRYNLEPLEHNIALKNRAITDGHAKAEQTEILASLKKEGTMIRGEAKAERTNWMKDLGLKDLFKEKADVAVFAGCKYSYDARLQGYARKAIDILTKAGVDMGTLGAGENCCASRAWQMGFEEEFNERAKNNIRAFEKAEVKTIITFCADCYYAFNRLYPALGMDIEVLHITQYIAKLLAEGKLKFTHRIDRKVTYHDPCHLGRLGEPFEPWDGHEKKILNQVQIWEPARPRYAGIHGEYEAPREILRGIPGIKLVEMERIREYAWCCGAGGGCNETDQELSEWTASERITEANSTGAEALITACPWCNDNLTGVKDEQGKEIEVIDILDLIAKAL
ncbi:MAG: (Fe-S)-binding protein [Firmicutes bacterium]|nr:(Fe-S)-binding protein [Bacillota bacterium]MBR0455707.1 (Fe-S)-binding protein [Bacillota bacterium]